MKQNFVEMEVTDEVITFSRDPEKTKEFIFETLKRKAGMEWGFSNAYVERGTSWNPETRTWLVYLMWYTPETDEQGLWKKGDVS